MLASLAWRKVKNNLAKNNLPCAVFTVKNFKVTYNSINGKDIFTNGDWVTGQVTLEVAKDCQINHLFIKFKGKAEMNWTERQGYGTVVYHSKQKYFSLKHYFIRDKTLTDIFPPLSPWVALFCPLASVDALLCPCCPSLFPGCFPSCPLAPVLLVAQFHSCGFVPGRHVYPFKFQIPLQDVPCSFTGSNADHVSVPGIKTHQHKIMEKKFNLFTSGAVTMTADIEKTVFFQGEGLKVVVRIINKSSREIKPKYCVYRKHSFFANGERRLETKDILKEVGTAITPSASKKVTRVITIPHDMEPSILNCNIIKVEYRLRVYLDVKYALDPEIKFPIIIMPASQVPAVVPPPAATTAAAAAAAASSDSGLEPFGKTNPPAAPQPFDPPPPYEAHGLYPPLTDFGNISEK
ncbi:arrestin domain-containing protein 3-like [Seriola aureovittata]|uniref:arrestin domain-containing protein 3-like n=1 Tax=Seriola aureovittata TaxID=2871759 RepID=UPI0024BDFAFD|nr:arrestin domain-containing protein 3-like [Seriola aureovittata]